MPPPHANRQADHRGRSPALRARPPRPTRGAAICLPRASSGERSQRVVWAVAALLLLGALAPAGCRPAPPPARAHAPLSPATLHGSNVLQRVADVVALGPREANTRGAQRAADYLANALKRIGLTPQLTEFTEATPNGTMTFRNVTAELQGRDPRRIVLVSHYDTKAGIANDFVGANDSGSSTGLLLELARLLAQADDLRPTLLFAFVDGEECRTRYGPHDGLHGSRHLAAALTAPGAPPLRAAIIVDMIGDRDLNVGIPRNSSRELVLAALNAADQLGYAGIFQRADGAVLDDHVPFLERGIPAIDLIDFQFGSAPGRNDYWHTPADTLDKLSAESLETVGRVVLQMLNELAP